MGRNLIVKRAETGVYIKKERGGDDCSVCHLWLLEEYPESQPFPPIFPPAKHNLRKFSVFIGQTWKRCFPSNISSFQLATDG